MNSKQNNNRNRAQGVVYSTNPDYRYASREVPEKATLPPQQQDLRVMLDKKLKGNKKATLVTGFVGSEKDLADLAKQLKNLCAAGGSSADGEILVQGDSRQKIMDFLIKKGYKAKFSGG
ncbi:MAG: translation initiation factor [Bacteroidetes bacterium HGW-Bacteroidetes-9]|jgi:translation initiation factor 1|nr:MAG: translation initiation factor [Bacteroidetes bacterium HGW-Bacteroidetes-9]